MSTAKGQSLRGFFPGLNDIWHKKIESGNRGKRKARHQTVIFFFLYAFIYFSFTKCQIDSLHVQAVQT